MTVKTRQRKPKISRLAEMRRVVKALGDNWMVRTSDNGVSHGGFKWGAIGVWTEAPDWHTGPTCDGGLFGQGPGGYGYCKAGTRFEFCETAGGRIVVDKEKIKVRHARILWTGADALAAMHCAVGNTFPGSLDLRGCDLKGVTLPQTMGGWLDLRGCDLKGVTLPQTMGGSLNLSGCDLKGVTLPQTMGGWLDLSGCDLKGVTLPQTMGGSLNLSGCKNVPDKLPINKAPC